MKKDHITTKTYTILACIIGFGLMDDLTGAEQNALGNWLYLVAQVLETNYAIQQAVEEDLKGYDININSKKAKQGGSPFSNDYVDKKVIKQLIKEVDLIKQKLDGLL